MRDPAPNWRTVERLTQARFYMPQQPAPEPLREDVQTHLQPDPPHPHTRPVPTKSPCPASFPVKRTAGEVSLAHTPPGWITAFPSPTASHSIPAGPSRQHRGQRLLSEAQSPPTTPGRGRPRAVPACLWPVCQVPLDLNLTGLPPLCAPACLLLSLSLLHVSVPCLSVSLWFSVSLSLLYVSISPAPPCLCLSVPVSLQVSVSLSLFFLAPTLCGDPVYLPVSVSLSVCMPVHVCVHTCVHVRVLGDTWISVRCARGRGLSACLSVCTSFSARLSACVHFFLHLSVCCLCVSASLLLSFSPAPPPLPLLPISCGRRRRQPFQKLIGYR